jgi:Effector protein
MTRFTPLIAIDGSAFWDAPSRQMVPVDLIFEKGTVESQEDYDTRMNKAIGDYERDVAAVLKEITGNKIGAALLHEFSWGHTINIVPFNGRRNAVTEPTRGADSLQSGVTAVVGAGPRQRRITGTGLGSDSRLAYNPTVSSELAGPGMKKDQFLFHEMVHAIRQNQGRTTQQSMGSGFDLREEFYAVVLANIYISFTDPSASLRANHHADTGKYASYGIPSLEMRDLRRFSEHFRTELLKLRDEMPGLTFKLSQIDCPFNPFKYFQDQEDAANPWNKPIPEGKPGMWS